MEKYSGLKVFVSHMASSSRRVPFEEEYANLAINDEDEEGLVLEGEGEEVPATDLAMCLVGSFVTPRKFNFVAMQDTLAAIWRPVKGVYMEETVMPNLFVFKFFHELDMQRVLDDGPWTFNNQALMVKRMEMGEQLSDIKLRELFMWVQVYDLPIGFNSEFILKSIGNYVGRFIQADPKNFQSIWRNFLRIKVAVDVYKPLKSQMRIKKAGGEWMWIKFKYERLPSFCFYCGIIGHSEKFCELLFDDNGRQGTRKYDASLRASVKNQATAGRNQWLRGADGGKLIERKVGENDENGEDDVQTESRDFRDKGWSTRGKGIMIDTVENGSVQGGGGIIGNGLTGILALNNKTDGQNSKINQERDNLVGHGLLVLDSKRRRVNEDTVDGPGEDKAQDDITMTETHGDELQNQKNEEMAGAVLQPRLGL